MRWEILEVLSGGVIRFDLVLGDCFGCCSEKRLWGSREISYKVVVIIYIRGDDGLDKGGSGGGVISGYILIIF